jgi:hypothetical protein
MKCFYCLLVVVMLVQCGPATRITSTWKSPDTAINYFNKIMVVGIINENDQSIQKEMEKHLVDDLKELGYDATSAYQVYGPRAFRNLTEEQVNKELQNKDIDAVLTIVLLSRETEKQYRRGSVYYRPGVIYYNRFWGYYRSVYTRIETPGYFEIRTNYFWESNLYELNDQKLLFSVQTRSFDPVDISSLAHQYSHNIIQKMAEQSVLKHLQKSKPVL